MGLLFLLCWTLSLDPRARAVQFDAQELENQRQVKRWYELEAKGPLARTASETTEYEQMIARAGVVRSQPAHLTEGRQPASSGRRKLLNLRDGTVDLELENLADQGQATWLNPRSEDTGPIGSRYRAKE